MKYSGEGLKLMIAMGWMEQPPESADRKSFLNGTRKLKNL